MAPDLLGIFLVQTTALGVLLICGLLVYRVFPQRYLLLWNAGWLLYLAHLAVSARPDWSAGLLALGLLLAAQAVQAGAVGTAAGQAASFRWLAPVAVAAFLVEALVWSAYPGARSWPCLIGYLLLGLIAATWMLQYGRRHHGLGPTLLTIALLLRLIHLPDLLRFQPLLRFFIPEAASSVLAMLSMLVLALDATRQHLRCSAAPGLIAAAGTDYTAPGRSGPGDPRKIAAEIQRVFEPAFSSIHLLEPGAPPDPEAEFLLAALPRPPSGQPLYTTVLDPEKGQEAAAWLKQRRLRWAVVVPIVHSRLAENALAGVFVLGYRARRWISPETMKALMIAGRQLGIVLENSRLLQQLGHAYREWVNTMDAIGDLILVHDPQYRIQRVNRALAGRSGYEPTAMIHRLCREVLPQASGSPWQDCPFCELPPRGDTFDESLHGYFLVSTTRYPPEDPTWILHVVKDITERKQAEEKYRTMFEKVHEGVFISTPAGRFIDLNDAMARMLGYERDELLAVHTPSLYCSEEDRKRYLQEMEAEGYVSDYEVRLRRKSGEAMIGLETSFATRDKSGRIVQLQGFLLDITARKKAEEELHQHVASLSAVNRLAERLTGSLDAQELLKIVVGELRSIFPFDTVAGYLINAEKKTAVRIAGEGFGQPDGAQALPLSDKFLAALEADRRAVVPLSELPPASPDVAALQQAEGLRSVVCLPLRGEQLLGGITLGWRTERQLTRAEENLLGAIGRQLNAALENAGLYQQARRAYEELRRTQEQLLQSEKMAALGQLVSGVAHELNNPLTAVIGYSQLLAPHVATPQGSDYLNKILHQAHRTHKIIQNLLSFSRQSKPERRLLDLNHLIEEALLLREYDLRRSSVRLERRMAPGLPLVHGDVQQLEQVFHNIISNACEAIQETGSGGALRVSTYAADGNVYAEFADGGPGMIEPARVFDPFYTTKTVGKGTGLGLSICYGIIKEHGGEIVAMNNPGGGATFRVRLPAARSGPTAGPYY